MSTCWFKDRWHRQITDRNTSILVCFELINVSGWLRGVLRLVLARGGRGPGCSVRCNGASRGGAALVKVPLLLPPSLPPSSTSSIHPSLLLTPFNDVKTNSDAFDAHLLLNFRAGTELELIGKLQPWIRKCAAPASVCKVKFPVRRQSLVPSSECVRAVSTAV